MASDGLVVAGVVMEEFRNAKFRVRVETGMDVMATISGKIRKNKVRILVGDSVQVELTLYDLAKGRIIWRG